MDVLKHGHQQFRENNHSTDLFQRPPFPAHRGTKVHRHSRPAAPTLPVSPQMTSQTTGINHWCSSTSPKYRITCLPTQTTPNTLTITLYTTQSLSHIRHAHQKLTFTTTLDPCNPRAAFTACRRRRPPSLLCFPRRQTICALPVSYNRAAAATYSLLFSRFSSTEKSLRGCISW
jgi:hypothetical protein